MTTTATTTTSSTSSPASREIDWPKPGPGTWTLDSGHFDANSSRICQDLIIEGMAQGTAEGFALIGAPLERMEAQFVNGRFYHRLRPLIGGSRDLRPPPAPVLWLVTRLHPAFRRAESTAEKAIANRVWMEEHRRWETEWKPRLLADCRRSSTIDVSSLSDQELADHLLAVTEIARFGTALHFRLHISDLGPIGLLLVRARSWDVDQAEVMATLAGHSPATIAPTESLAEIRQIVASQPSPPTSLDDVRAISTEASALLDDFLAEYGFRMTTGYDIRGRTLREMPDAVLAAVTASVDDTSTTSSQRAEAAGAEALAAVRSKIPAAEHAELEQLVSDARALYGLRDENGPLTYQWPAGLIRHAVLEARLRLSDRLAGVDADAIFDLSADEIAGLLRGHPSPNVSEIDRRVSARKAGIAMQAPPLLGPEEADPPLWTMPPSLGQLLDVIFTVLELLENEHDADGALRGVGIGDAAYTGRACVVGAVDEALDRLEPGDILVAAYTVPTYNSVLSMAGAVVVDNGGLLCHAAVIAREFGIPGVVGVGRATTEITNGSTIEVDPVAGTVRVVSPAPRDRLEVPTSP